VHIKLQHTAYKSTHALSKTAKIANLFLGNPQKKTFLQQTNTTLLTMTKKKVNKKQIQTSTLDTMPMSPPRDRGR
jgi:hypothetical protein